MYTGNVLEAKNKLAVDLNTVIEDTEQLLQATANQANEKVIAARARVQESIKAVKQKIDAHPWPVIGFAAAVGALVGLLITRR
jgi:ElaB/YqjD/DUF883 family membrane-anchored ribosome-binding protein